MYYHELHFLSCDDNIDVKNTDYRTFKYENKKKTKPSIYTEGKKTYCESRGQAWHITSKQSRKLKDLLHEFEENLKDHAVVHCEWKSESLICVVFSNGLIAYISINSNTVRITGILFDRYCVGKLPFSNINAVVFTGTNLLLTCNENVALLVNFNKSTRLDKINNRDPKQQVIDLFGLKNSERRMSTYSDRDTTKVLIWTSMAPGEIYPWSPVVREEDRANIHIYLLNRGQMTLESYHRIENEPMSVEISKLKENLIHSIELKTYQKNRLGVEWCIYEVRDGELLVSECSSVAVPAPVRLAQRCPSDRRLLLVCIDASLLLYSHTVTRIVKAAFIASTVCWCDGGVVLCDERGRLQCFDLSLAPWPTPAQSLHVGAHFKQQCCVDRLVWSGDSTGLLLLSFREGPFTLIRLSFKDVYTRWMRASDPASCIELLRSLDWDIEGDICLQLLHALVIYLLRFPLNALRESQLQSALGCFHVPAAPLSQATLADYGAQVHDLTRKFFHHLVRYGRLDKALSLAVDLSEWDLFVDVESAARRAGHRTLKEEAYSHVLASTQHITCSTSSCSQCSSTDRSSVSGDEDQEEAVEQRSAPPLPQLPSSASIVPPIPVVPQEPLPTAHSIRPNLHQYLDRECSLWTDRHHKNPMPNNKPMHRVIDIIPKPSEEASTDRHYDSIYQTELPEESSHGHRPWQNLKMGIERKDVYESVYRQKCTLPGRYTSNVLDTDGFMADRRSPASKRVDKIQGEENVQQASATKAPGEKNKVKFSEFVTVAVVPEIPRKDKNNAANIILESHLLTDPKKELADSLPLCHPNDDYLKDFAPIDPDADNNESPSKIKVVHFGILKRTEEATHQQL